MSSTFSLKTFPIQSTTQQMFSKIAHLPWSVLLESANPDHIDNRFDIFSADPVATVQTTGNQTTVTEGEQKISYADRSPLQLLKDVQQRVLGSDPGYQGELPFTGGSIGLLGYDLGRQFEKLPEQASRDIDLPDLAVGIYDWAWIIDHKTGQAHFLVCGSQTDLEHRWEWWQQQVTRNSETFELKSSWKSNLSQQEYTERFNA
ncbi:MAG: aminodeoxychorismate synthase component I, partial [Gammaproteobacteria bacterium]|nr:aminodeoxychorismate synthase component I [Gammaproteobacteria bacterium]